MQIWCHNQVQIHSILKEWIRKSVKKEIWKKRKKKKSSHNRDVSMDGNIEKAKTHKIDSIELCENDVVTTINAHVQRTDMCDRHIHPRQKKGLKNIINVICPILLMECSFDLIAKNRFEWKSTKKKSNNNKKTDFVGPLHVQIDNDNMNKNYNTSNRKKKWNADNKNVENKNQKAIHSNLNECMECAAIRAWFWLTKGQMNDFLVFLFFAYILFIFPFHFFVQLNLPRSPFHR